MSSAPEIQILRPDHAPALLTFERENRVYFAASIPDRGDAYFEEFEARHRALLAEQAAGICFFHVLADSAGEIVGRINLVDVANGSAWLGYRIAEKAAGKGLATSAVRQICELARQSYGLTEVRAETTTDNLGSQNVLSRTGFVVTGETVLSSRPGLRYVKAL